jgi:2-oxoglutarate ferredoxin oxidoreductase subunit alpha
LPEERILITGNEAAGEAAIRAGCRYYYGYPITPQNELTAYMALHMPEAGGVFIQAESELAAINMCFGTAATGRRTMTSSSSPGISLKQEGISYCAGAELPVVIVNVMRGGPGLGNIEPAQGDYFQATKGGGHGDYRIIVLAPHSVEEFAELVMLAFDLGDLYRTPVLLLADGQLGQMMEPCSFRAPPRRELPPKDWALTGAAGRPRRIARSFYLPAGVLAEHCKRLQAKFELIRQREVRYEERGADEAEVLLVAYGTSARLSLEAARVAKKRGLKLGLIRPITLWPFPDEAIRRWAERGNRFLVVEMSAGQMVEDVRLAVEGRAPVGFVGRSGGGAPTTAEILQAAEALAAKK